MKSDALIAELQRLQDEHGVLEVRVYDYAEIEPDAVTAGGREGPAGRDVRPAAAVRSPCER
ncbi:MULTISPECIES: hypothetical protein [unclassified Streptomyces]|uniref:hypothetical protein n=1 Tax=unclassified Streptomyces TaxID=2593676 RepID=UPI00036EC6B1|nr:MULTISPECIES: hypothetical protein [unclassified Streptomyces]MYX39043.1 hypothetical protein [Streptomyces sp. SID8377]